MAKKSKAAQKTARTEREKFGEKLRAEREAQEIGLRELARKLRVSPSYVSDLELGKRSASDALRAKLVKRFPGLETLGVCASCGRAF